MYLKSPIFVALDVDSDSQALNLAKEVGEYVGGFKIGPRLCMRYGPQLVQLLSERGPVFVDNKYYDIPSVMEHSVRATFAAGATYCTVHTTAGAAALSRLAEVERELSQHRPFHILGVTVLTSYGADDLPPNWKNISPAEHVQALAQLAFDSGLSGLVCSGEESQALRQLYPESFLVVPGIRRPEDAKGDQSRVLSPQDGLRAGASALVVGRPIVQAQNPREVAKAFWQLCQ